MLIYRAAQPGDLDDIMRLIHEAQAFMRTLGIDQWQDGYPSREILYSDIEIGQAFVYADEETGRVSSIAIFSLLPEPIYNALDGEWKTDGDYLTIHRMALDDAARGSGVAGDMLKKAIMDFCYLSVNKGKSDAIMMRYGINEVFTLSYDSDSKKFSLTLCVGDGNVNFKLFNTTVYRRDDSFTSQEMNRMIEDILSCIESIYEDRIVDTENNKARLSDINS